MSQTRPQGCEQHEGASETAVLLPGPAAPPPSNGGDRDITLFFHVNLLGEVLEVVLSACQPVGLQYRYKSH
jgi:hypothetical protein